MCQYTTVHVGLVYLHIPGGESNSTVILVNIQLISFALMFSSYTFFVMIVIGNRNEFVYNY